MAPIPKNYNILALLQHWLFKAIKVSQGLLLARHGAGYLREGRGGYSTFSSAMSLVFPLDILYGEEMKVYPEIRTVRMCSFETNPPC